MASTVNNTIPHRNFFVVSDTKTKAKDKTASGLEFIICRCTQVQFGFPFICDPPPHPPLYFLQVCEQLSASMSVMMGSVRKLVNKQQSPCSEIFSFLLYKQRGNFRQRMIKADGRGGGGVQTKVHPISLHTFISDYSGRTTGTQSRAKLTDEFSLLIPPITPQTFAQIIFLHIFLETGSEK